MQILEHILKIRREKKAKQEFWQSIGNQFRIAKSNTPVHCSFAKFASHKTYAKFRIAKIRSEFANQFRNANFAMPTSISQCQFQFRNANFAMPNSQAKTLFICLTKTSKSLAKFRIANFRNSLANFATALRNSQPCELIAKFPLFCPPILFCA